MLQALTQCPLPEESSDQTLASRSIARQIATMIRRIALLRTMAPLRLNIFLHAGIQNGSPEGMNSIGTSFTNVRSQRAHSSMPASSPPSWEAGSEPSSGPRQSHLVCTPRLPTRGIQKR